MSLKGKIRRASKRAEALQKKAKKKEGKGKYGRAEKLQKRADEKKEKVARLKGEALGKAAKSAIMGTTYSVSDPMDMKKSLDVYGLQKKKFNKK